MQTFQVGDKVRLVDAIGEGTVLRLHQKEVIVDMEGMEMAYHPSDLVKIEYDNLIKRHSGPAEKVAKDRLSELGATRKLKELVDPSQAVYEIDLHIHELLDRYNGMSNGEILQYQMNACRRFVREAMDKRYRKIILIHGVGEGVLKTEIHRYLDQLTNAEYHDAPYRTYGYGATEVLLR